MKNLVRLSRVSNATSPIARATLYKWRVQKKNPEIFLKLSGAVFLDLDRLDKLLEAGRGK